MKLKIINHTGQDHYLLPVKDQPIVYQALELLQAETEEDLAYAKHVAGLSLKTKDVQTVKNLEQQLTQITKLLQQFKQPVTNNGTSNL